MNPFETVVFLLAIIPLVTGLLKLVMGLRAQALIGARLPPEVFDDALLNSQMRFYGTIWFGFGVLLCLCLSDISAYSSLLRGSLAIVFLGGIGRVATLFQFGVPAGALGTAFVAAVTAIEIVEMPLLFWWHWQLVG